MEAITFCQREFLLKKNQRPIWIIIFAILLACIAIRTNGQEIQATRLDQVIASAQESLAER
jgi:hypothetical protein